MHGRLFAVATIKEDLYAVGIGKGDGVSPTDS